MNKQEYINRYNKKYLQIRPEFRKDYEIDNDYIYSGRLCESHKYKIDDIVTLLNFYDEAKAYIYHLKQEDKILVNHYAVTEQVKIEKINYKRQEAKKKIISSITVTTDTGYQSKIKTTDILYKDIKIYDLKDVCLHFWNYLFFDEFVIENADKLLEKIKMGVN